MVFKHAFTYFTTTKFSFLVQFRTFKILLIQISYPNFPLRYFPVYRSTNTIWGGRNKDGKKEKQPHRSLAAVIIKNDPTGEIS